MVSRVPPTRCGIAEYASMLAEGEKSIGIDVFFLADLEGVELGRKGFDPYSGIKAVPCFYSRPGFSKQVIDALSKKGAEVVHFQHEYGVFPDNEEFVELVKKVREMGMRVVVTMHTVAHALHKPEWIDFHKALGKAVDLLIVHSPLQHAELAFQGVELDKIRVVPHGTLINPFVGVVKKSIALRKLGLDSVEESTPIITTPGFVRADKGLDVLLKSFEILRFNYDVKLLLIGHPQDGSDTATRIKEFVNSREWLAKDVYFVQTYLPREALLLLLAAVDVVVLPYSDRGLLSVSGALHLAIGSKKPVVCTQTPRLAECYTLAPELSISMPSPREIAKKISMILEGESVVKECVDRLWQYALLTRWERIAKRHLELYLEALEK